MQRSPEANVLLLLLACADDPKPVDTDEPVDTGCDAPATWYADADGDGFGDAGAPTEACEAPAAHVADATDCDDADATVSPAAAEVCGGADEDCDGAVDEPDATDAATWYADADGDTFGDAGAATVACVAPAAHVADATDCDDTDATVSPASPETCGGVDEDCDGTTDEDDAIDVLTWYADADGDTYGAPGAATLACDAPVAHVSDATDCDDTDATVSPAAPEVCGGADEDCDGTTDEDDAVDVLTWYADADGDTFGDAEVATFACEAPVACVADSTDCDDTDANVSPASTEVCGGGDEDCDGTTDEPDAVGAGTWYADTDGDSFGDASVATVACDAPAAYVADAADCNDADATVSPAGSEVCGGGDEDCDGTTDEDDATDAGTWYADADGDTFGDTGASTVACAAPAGYVPAARDCDDTDADVSPGATEVCGDGVDQDCSGADRGCGGSRYAGSYDLETTAPYLTGSTIGDWYGANIAAGADVDGDGYDDIAIGARNYESSSGSSWPYKTGRVYVHRGPLASGGSIAAILDGEEAADLLGSALAMVGDTLVIGAHQWSTNDGRVYVVPFSAIPTDGSDAIVTDYATAVLDGEGHRDRLGHVVSDAGDVDGDGNADLLVGAYSFDDGSEAGRAYLVPGPLDLGSASIADVHSATFTGGAAGDRAGMQVAGGGDLDGDGLADVVVAAPQDDDGGSNAGAVFVYTGAPSGAYTLDASSADAARIGEAAGDYLGFGLDSRGDIDGDGYDDLIAGAWWADPGGTQSGEAYVFFGPLSGSASASTADVDVTGEVVEGYLGYTAVSLPDVDGDGADEVVLGAYNLGATPGRVYLLYGGVLGSLSAADADASFEGSRPSEYAGYALAAGTDADQDGVGDLAIGAWYDPADGVGRVYMVPGVAP